MDRFSNSAYASCVMTCAILYALSYRRPPPPPKGRNRATADSVTSSPLLSTMTASISLCALAPAIGVTTTLIALSDSEQKSSPTSSPALLCPRPANINGPTFLTFNTITVAVLLCTFCGSLLRYAAMAQLGRSFTWELARPAAGFKRDGLYAYVRHPSYTGAFVANVAFLPFFWRLDGPLGCWVPASWTARSRVVCGVHVFVTVAAMLWTLWKRIPEEEGMMGKEFGKEWVEYQRRTKRFVPGLF